MNAIEMRNLLFHMDGRTLKNFDKAIGNLDCMDIECSKCPLCYAAMPSDNMTGCIAADINREAARRGV